jgi:hypothetical protein
MDAASRPSLELLPDLPVEAPLDSAIAPQRPPTLGAAGSAGMSLAASAAAPKASKDPEQTDLHFIDPELFLAPDEVAPTPAPAPLPPAADTFGSLGLTLEDPVIDEMLTSPGPPPAPARTVAVPPTLNGAPAASNGAKSAATDLPARSMERVPIAKTAALTAAATKLAAASAAQQQRAPLKPAVIAPPAVVPTAHPAAMQAPVLKSAAQPSMRAATAQPPRVDPAAKTDAPKAEAASLASWASARAAAAPKPALLKAVPTAAAPRTAPAAAPSVKSTTPKAAAPAAQAAASAPTPGASPPMDRDFIARNQVVERYLSGRLPLKGATDFERFCNAHPEILDEIGLPERVNAGLRLLEASGKPEPWQEAPLPVWQKPQVTLGLAAAVLALVIALALVAGNSAAKSHRITALQKQAFERALDPATSTREIRLLPNREGASNSPAITIGGGSVQLADFKIDESRSPYHSFRITIDRIDQGRVGVITNLTKDSNGHLRIALNSSALGPGNYQLTIEGLNWRGETEPDSWVTIGVLR